MKECLEYFQLWTENNRDILSKDSFISIRIFSGYVEVDLDFLNPYN